MSEPHLNPRPCHSPCCCCSLSPFPFPSESVQGALTSVSHEAPKVTRREKILLAVSGASAQMVGTHAHQMERAAALLQRQQRGQIASRRCEQALADSFIVHSSTRIAFVVSLCSSERPPHWLLLVGAGASVGGLHVARIRLRHRQRERPGDRGRVECGQDGQRWRSEEMGGQAIPAARQAGADQARRSD